MSIKDQEYKLDGTEDRNNLYAGVDETIQNFNFNLDINIDEWCSFEGNCKIPTAPFPKYYEVCFLCKYLKKLDIPQMIKD
jgi:hypothetical protein